MKGIFEEYGAVIVATLIGLSVLNFLFFSVTSPQGVIHKFVVTNMESMGASTQVVLEEWTVDDIKIVLKDNGGLYISGTGTLPSYDDVEDTPWAQMKEYIDFVEIEESVTFTGDIPIK